MKKIISLAAIMLTACITTPENLAENTQSSSSEITHYSSSSEITPQYSSSIYSSSSEITHYSSSSSNVVVQKEPTFIAEVGYVCTDFNTFATSPGKATEGLIAMYNICGDMATMTTGTQPRVTEVIVEWMIYDLGLTESFTNILLSDLEHYGTTLRFYDAVDGYLRYIYIEPVGDGIGLMRKLPKGE